MDIGGSPSRHYRFSSYERGASSQLVGVKTRVVAPEQLWGAVAWVIGLTVCVYDSCHI